MTAAVTVLHYSVEFERDDEGWWTGKCVCGWGGGKYPDAEDAADALMAHTWEQGYLEAKRLLVEAAAARADIQLPKHEGDPRAEDREAVSPREGALSSEGA